MTGNVIYAGMKVSYLEYSYLGIMIYLVLGQMSQTIYRTTIDKKYGLLALKLLSGIKPFYYVIGMSTYAMLGLSVQMFALIILANFLASITL